MHCLMTDIWQVCAWTLSTVTTTSSLVTASSLTLTKGQPILRAKRSSLTPSMSEKLSCSPITMCSCTAFNSWTATIKSFSLHPSQKEAKTKGTSTWSNFSRARESWESSQGVSLISQESTMISNLWLAVSTDQPCFYDSSTKIREKE